MARNRFYRMIPGSALILWLGLGLPILGQTRIKPGMNLFSIQQDVELGREAARETEQQLPMLKDPESNEYISTLGRKLARNTNLPDLPWQFQMVNSSEVNAFALPGGYVFVNRGLIETAETEGELAGVLCHEISHVTLRHGTNQVSKAMLAQAPLAALGGLSGGSGGLLSQIAQLGVGVGINLAFMKFSRTAEMQADVAGVQLMGRSGYDPEEMVRMFEILEHLSKREPSKLEQWFSSHPTPENRIGRLRQEIALIHPSGNLTKDSARYDAVRAHLRALPPAPKGRVQPQARGQAGRVEKPEPPSRNFAVYRQPQGLFSISHPSNWKASGGGTGVVLAPDRGIEGAGNQSHIVYGALVNLFEAHGRDSRRALSLEEGMDELIDHLLHGNPYLTQVSDRRADRLAGAEALSVTLSGAPRGGRPEVVEVIARRYDNEMLYIAFVAPEEDFKTYQPTFREMARTLRASE